METSEDVCGLATLSNAPNPVCLDEVGLNMSDGELLSTFQVFFLLSFDCT